MYRKIIPVALLALLFSGCSESEEAEVTKQDEETMVEEKQTNEKTDSKEADLSVIDQIVIPTTIEEWKNTEPGLFALDYTIDHETSSWPQEARDLNAEEKKELKSVIEVADDTDTMYKALRYYFGSHVYKDLLEKQINYAAVMNEPYLPKPTKEFGEEGNNQEAAPTKAFLLLDASSSMLLPVDGKEKMGIAKIAVKRFAKTLGTDNEVSLYVYGHAGTQENKDKELSCTKIDEVYPLQNYKEEEFNTTVDEVAAKGWTPLAAAIQTVNEASKNVEGPLTVYIVSDGAETCDGDPVSAAQEFAQDNENRKVNIIGFNVDQKGDDQLKAVAEAGNGEYISADNGEELNNSIEDKWVIPSMTDVVWIKHSGPNGFTVGNAKYAIGQMSMKLSNAVNIESSRFKKMIQLLVAEESITSEQGEELNEKVNQHSDQLKAINTQLRDDKNKEVDDEYNRIHQKIDAWVKEIEKIRSEQ
ncbi:Ca-activated chloride channel family protein [Psychrobacillus sp. OK028]|uniref:VWA domain-containing protein n=1 Tax=Psychrobacillus sp. OK028 TaxID=1884359 RepID=UPI000884A9D5|nr:VWA domain-containing protein [Psychrobacillus sp. OK028]SDN59565.1 Ca-activated chloride channel family protein [Psychrobacillus sp. OK028]